MTLLHRYTINYFIHLLIFIITFFQQKATPSFETKKSGLTLLGLPACYYFVPNKRSPASPKPGTI